MDFDELTNSAGLADVCNDIIDNKTSEYPALKAVVFDTYDHLIDIAEQESIRLFNQEWSSREVCEDNQSGVVWLWSR